jgi:hypothetical protein
MYVPFPLPPGEMTSLGGPTGCVYGKHTFTFGVDRLILRPQPVLAEAHVEKFSATTAQALKIS